MSLEEFRELCLSFPATSEEIKWEKDLCFLIGKKMFAVADVDAQPLSISFKTTPENFDELVERPGFFPAPYLARYKWVAIKDINGMSKDELSRLIGNSYQLVLDKLPQKAKTKLGL